MDDTEVLTGPLHEKFLDILKSDGINDEVDHILLTRPKELRGEHYATETVYITVIFKDSSIPKRNLFAKKFSDNETHTAYMKQMRVMEKESAFFNKFLPALNEFCKNKGSENLLDFFPKCLYGDDDILVQNNLVLNDGWVMLPKEDKQDLKTAKVVLGKLAKFHAASHCFIQEECGGYDKFVQDWEPIATEAFLFDNDPMMMQMFDNGITTCLNLLKGHPVEGHEEVSATLVGYLGKTYGICSGLMKRQPEDKLLVLNHGDCWNNNMLFKKDGETGEVIDHIFIDLQITRLASPNLDIGYYMYNSVKLDVIDNDLLEMLMHYYTSLEDAMKLFDKKCPWTFKEFLDDYLVKSQFGFFFGLTMMSAIAAMKDFDFADAGNSPEEMMEAFTNVINKWVADNPVEAKKVATDIVRTVKEYGKMRDAKFA